MDNYFEKINKIKSIEATYISNTKPLLQNDTAQVKVHCKISHRNENDTSYIFYFYIEGSQNNYYYDGEIFYIVNDDSIKKIRSYKQNWKRIRQEIAHVNFTPITDKGQLLLGLNKRAEKKITEKDRNNFEINYSEKVRGGDLLIRKFCFSPNSVFPTEYTFISNALQDLQYWNYKMIAIDTNKFLFETLRNEINDSINIRIQNGYKLIANTNYEMKKDEKEDCSTQGAIFQTLNISFLNLTVKIFIQKNPTY
ncbi:MAG: hypothetical protein SGJ10_11060 [Bacteroidota bacterium]|nr:hypothetical protein [Bacteroidota bacterium]